MDHFVVIANDWFFHIPLGIPLEIPLEVPREVPVEVSPEIKWRESREERVKRIAAFNAKRDEKRLRFEAARARVAAARKVRQQQNNLMKRLARTEKERMKERTQHNVIVCQKNAKVGIVANVLKVMEKIEAKREESKKKKEVKPFEEVVKEFKEKQVEMTQKREEIQELPPEVELEIAVRNILEIDN